MRRIKFLFASMLLVLSIMGGMMLSQTNNAAPVSDHEHAKSLIPGMPEVPAELWKEWPILAVLATVVFFQCSLIMALVIWQGKKMDKLSASYGQFGHQLSLVMSDAVGAVNTLVTLCHVKNGQVPPKPVSAKEDGK